MEIDDLKQALNETWVRVEFTKLDGTHRSMLCTRNFVDIPESQKPAGIKKQNEAVLGVFDLEKQSWRSIKLANIKTWQVEDRTHEQ